ncbi:MAG: TatD family deoxyribonuclease [Firmicutes bacterium]|nr:TatD family deoxyribonuclease [Bacillota bacterium]
MYIDTHCHLSKEDYDDIDLIINDNILAGVEKVIISGCTRDSILESIELSKKYDCVYVTLGYHPSEVNEINDNSLLELEDIIKNNSKVVGVGEIGLDYYYGKDDIDKQKKLFRDQLQLAEKLNLPVVIHSRDAVLDTINILKEYPTLRGVIHCFGGSLETANIYIKMGYLLGIGGVVTFKNSKLGEVIKNVDLSNIVLETDSPYLTPEPFRGKKNSSKYIPLVAEKISNIKNVDVFLVEEITTNNANKIFDLK